LTYSLLTAAMLHIVVAVLLHCAAASRHMHSIVLIIDNAVLKLLSVYL
jgi:hypothetical protein